MKMHRNDSQLKEEENSTEGANNDRVCFSLTDTEFKKEIMKILKELRMIINGKADYYKKKLETIRRNQEKLENSFSKMKAQLKVMNSRMNNAEE